ncbi:4-galactosyl-N-acetylglucosaminide 3-alpha-L-fucosyltransferase FUT6-like [Diadema antillarum]
MSNVRKGILTRPVIIPSQMTNSALFKNGSCYRQIHLWANLTRSFSGRTGDFFCSGLPCGLRLVVDTDMGSFKKSDAVLLYHREAWNWTEFHRQRPRGQKWIFYTFESPRNTNKRVIPPIEYRNNSYDYIMTYRLNSHLYGSYGRYDPKIPQLRSTDIQSLLRNRTKHIAWMASNCDSVSWDRNGFVYALNKYIPVSMYGRCGYLTCPRDDRCNQELRKHKFYLALENSECREYITEKLWGNAFLNDIVPVVYGPPREDYEKVLPPNSFIHVQDFKSVKELAKYLLELEKDESRYSEFFEWKKFGSVKLTVERWLMEPEQVCSSIVSRLLADEEKIKDGTYSPPKLPEDWETWWYGSCTNKTQYPI